MDNAVRHHVVIAIYSKHVFDNIAWTLHIDAIGRHEQLGLFVVTARFLYLE